MVCIYCGEKTHVTNSRPQKRLGTTWRRRECYRCYAIFSTIEQADLNGSIRIRHATGLLEPFSRDKLFMSLASALGHRRDASETAGALTAAIIAKLLQMNSGAIVERETLVLTTHRLLADFDVPAGMYYAAYHGVV